VLKEEYGTRKIRRKREKQEFETLKRKQIRAVADDFTTVNVKYKKG
jgi:hypothetical protein